MTETKPVVTVWQSGPDPRVLRLLALLFDDREEAAEDKSDRTITLP